MSFSRFFSVILILGAGLAGGIGQALAEKMKFDRHDLTFVKRTTDFTGNSPYSIVIVRGVLPAEVLHENPYLEERVFLTFNKYDPEKKTLIGYESDLKGSFGISTKKNKKNKLKKRFSIFRIYPGHYILSSTNLVGPGIIHRNYISGETLAFEFQPGKLYYLGDFELFPKSPRPTVFGLQIGYNFLGHDTETVREFLKLYKDIDAELVIQEFHKDSFKCNPKNSVVFERQTKKTEPFCETEMRKH